MSPVQHLLSILASNRSTLPPFAFFWVHFQGNRVQTPGQWPALHGNDSTALVERGVYYNGIFIFIDIVLLAPWPKQHIRKCVCCDVPSVPSWTVGVSVTFPLSLSQDLIQMKSCTWVQSTKAPSYGGPLCSPCSQPVFLFCLGSHVCIMVFMLWLEL